MSRILQVFCIFFSALMLALGIPNELYLTGSPIFGFLSLVPLYLVYSNLKSYKESFIFMALHSFLVHLMSSYWLACFKDFAAATLGSSAVGTALIGGLCGLFFYIPFSRFNKKEQNFLLPYRNFYTCKKIFWFSICYVTWEWIKSTGFLAYPWGTLCQTTYHLKLFTQIVDITGVYGITFLVSSFAALIGEALCIYFSKEINEVKIDFIQSYIRTASVIALLFAFSFVYGFYEYTKNRIPEKYVNTILVQQNADPWSLSSDNETILVSERLTQEKLTEAKKAGHNVDLIVWSEGCLKYRFPASYMHYKSYPKEKPLITFIKETKIPFLLGGSYNNSTREKHFNGALLFDSEGNFRGAYPKNHLVPIAEAIPFADIKPFAKFFKKVTGFSVGWSAGDKYTLFNIPCQKGKEKLPEVSNVISIKEPYKNASSEQNTFVTFSAPICYDDAFPDVTRPLVRYGSEFFMNITDDSWSRTKSAEFQHFVVSYYRAIEHRTTLARSTNSGYSVVINPAGKIVMDMPVFKQYSEFVQIPVYKKQATIYQRFGNWLSALCFLSVLFSMVYVYLNRNKNLFENSERKLFNQKSFKKELFKDEKKSKKVKKEK